MRVNFMTDKGPERLAPLRELASSIDERRLLELVDATLEVLEKDTAQVLDQTNIARDIAGRTAAGDWIANTELREIQADAAYFLEMYKHQREGITQLKTAVRDKLNQSTIDAQKSASED